MSEIQHTGGNSVPAKSDEEMLKVLGNSTNLYSGAAPESIRLVLSYCKAAKLDPLMKPLHIVKMSVKNPQTGKYEFKDTLMPGIALYRTLAARTGKYAGIDEPEFGPMAEISGVHYPEWCAISVYKVGEDGRFFKFVAKEFWIENYATQGKSSALPNATWQKRPFGMLAKCAEAQALRKAFPEACTGVTAEEMDGKDMKVVEAGVEKSAPPADISMAGKVKRLPKGSAMDAFEELNESENANASQKQEGETAQQKLYELIQHYKVPKGMVAIWLKKHNVKGVSEFSDEQAVEYIEWICNNSAAEQRPVE